MRHIKSILLAAFLTLTCSPASAAFLNGGISSGGAGGVGTVNITIASGTKLLLITQTCYAGDAYSTPSLGGVGGGDTLVNPSAGGDTANSDLRNGMLYVFNPSTGAYQVIGGVGCRFGTISASAYDDIDTSFAPSSSEHVTTVTNSATSLATGSITPSGSFTPNTWLFASLGLHDGGTYTVGIDSSFTLRATASKDPVNGTSSGSYTADLKIGSAAATNPTWSSWSSASASATILIFKALTAPAGATNKLMIGHPIP